MFCLVVVFINAMRFYQWNQKPVQNPIQHSFSLSFEGHTFSYQQLLLWTFAECSITNSSLVLSFENVILVVFSSVYVCLFDHIMCRTLIESILSVNKYSKQVGLKSVWCIHLKPMSEWWIHLGIFVRWKYVCLAWN